MSDDYCIGYMKVGDHWMELDSSPDCAVTRSSIADRAAAQPTNVFAVYSWDADLRQWFGQFYNATGGGSFTPPQQPPAPPLPSDWKELPANCDKIPIKKDYWYSALLSVDVSKDKLLTFVPASLTLTNYAERPDLQGHKSGYRVVAVTGYAKQNDTPKPTCVPSPANLVDDSRAIKIWYAAPGKAPIRTVAATSMWTPILVGAGALGTLAGGWWYLARRRRQLRARAATR
jgi:hypothetical protein